MPRKFTVRIQREAAAELDHIYAYLYRQAPHAAVKFLMTLKKKVLTLRSFPYRGTQVRLLAHPKDKIVPRFIEHNGYLIFYKVEQNIVFVLHIAGPGQDWIQLLI